jgi:hypothetical protein
MRKTLEKPIVVGQRVDRVVEVEVSVEDFPAEPLPEIEDQSTIEEGQRILVCR